MMLNRSLRYKVPLNLSIAILLTGFVIAGVLIWRSQDEARHDLFRNSTELARALSQTLVQALRHDDLWQAYQILRSASPDESVDRALVLLDQEDRVYVSNRPSEFPIASSLRQMSPELARLTDAVRNETSLQPMLYEEEGDARLYVVTPVIDDSIRVATLIMGYPEDIFRPQLIGIAQNVGVTSLAVMAFLIPLGWYVGNRTVRPILRLSESIKQVGRVPLDEIEYDVLNSDDEIGQLNRHFVEMLEAMKEKSHLEQHMIVSERLAAIGRLAAGVAHEINNPLGGMINALNTQRRFGDSDRVSDQTLSLLERGLRQIQETVAALLVEARAEAHELTPQDIDDVRMLVLSNAEEKDLRLTWSNDLDKPLRLPSTPIRQVLMNLSLNAVQAAHRSGFVQASVSCLDNMLEIQVSNDGATLSNEEIGLLFEPFAHGNPKGTGLGLWVTYQIVRQFEGEIFVKSEYDVTHFTVQIPIKMAA